MPYLFYVSAIAGGLAMVSFESIVSAWAFKRKQETDIISGLGKGTAITLLIYLVLKIADLAYRGALPLAFDGSTAGRMFLFEVGLGFVVPMILLFLRPVRESVGGVLFSACLVIAGLFLNRFNTNFFAQLGNGVTYFPTWREIGVTLGLIALGVFLYRLAVLYLPVLHEAETEH
jgi:Ni/Fe-hydrogenase subunit HybB-like protein